MSIVKDINIQQSRILAGAVSHVLSLSEEITKTPQDMILISLYKAIASHQMLLAKRLG